MTNTHVTFRWKDRAHGSVIRTETVPGVEFVARYLRHVVPKGLKTIRHYGFQHPAAKDKQTRIAFHTGRPLVIDENPKSLEEPGFCCSNCGATLRLANVFRPNWSPSRAPPAIFHEESASV